MRRRRYLSVLGAAALSGCAKFGTDETTRTPADRTTSPGQTAGSTSPKPTEGTTDATPADDPPEGETTAADSTYRTIRVEANQYRSISVEAGESLENVLVDISAKGASAQIVASGADWSIRNVGFHGVHPGGHYLLTPAASAGSAATVENLYMGDGQVGGSTSGGIWIPPEHEGTIEFRRVNVQRFADNGLYGTNSAADTGGIVHVSDSYFRSNNDANVRVGTAAGTCTVRNTVSVGDADTPVSPHHGDEHGHGSQCRGVWAWWGDVVVEDCDIHVEESVGENLVEASKNEAAAKATITTRNTRVGSRASREPPSGVPLTAAAAARGGFDRGRSQNRSRSYARWKR